MDLLQNVGVTAGDYCCVNTWAGYCESAARSVLWNGKQNFFPFLFKLIPLN